MDECAVIYIYGLGWFVSISRYTAATCFAFSFKVKILTFVKTWPPAGSGRAFSPIGILAPWLLDPPNPLSFTCLPAPPSGARCCVISLVEVSGFLAGGWCLSPFRHTHALEHVSAVKFDLSHVCSLFRAVPLSVHHMSLQSLIRVRVWQAG